MVLKGRSRSINSQRRSRSELIITYARQNNALVAIINSGEKYFDSNMIQKKKIDIAMFSKDFFCSGPRSREIKNYMDVIKRALLHALR